jgi:hypothetical protein
MAAIATQLGRGKEAVNPQDLPTRPNCLVFAERDELRPTRIADGLGKIVVLDHACNVQRFKRQRTVGIDQFTAQLVLKVLALIGDPLMQNGHRQAGLVSGVAVLDLLAQAPLANLQTPLAFVQGFRLEALVLVAQGGKDGQAQVNPDLG